MSSPAIGLTLGSHVATPQLPSYFWTAFAPIHQVNSWWNNCRNISLYTNPDNFSSLFAGHVFQALFDNNPLYKTTAILTLIVKTILASFIQLQKVATEYLKLKEALRGRNLNYKKISWESPNERESLFTLSSSSSHWLQQKMSDTKTVITAIAYHTFLFIKESFILSMHIIDAYKAFMHDPNTIQMGKAQLFINIDQIREMILEIKDSLKDTLEKNRSFTKKIICYAKPNSLAFNDAWVTQFENEVLNIKTHKKELRYQTLLSRATSFLSGSDGESRPAPHTPVRNRRERKKNNEFSLSSLTPKRSVRVDLPTA